MTHGASVAVFIAQLVVLLVGGRLMGKLMQMLPHAQRRLVTTLFLGTALSISSVKSSRWWRADIAAVHPRRAAHAPGRVGLAAGKNILTSVRRG